MESYSEELRTPPLALVGLLGRSDLHATISEFLRKDQRPPINSFVVANLQGYWGLGVHKSTGSNVQCRLLALESDLVYGRRTYQHRRGRADKRDAHIWGAQGEKVRISGAQTL
eukprot:1176598-Prorocentrum_minimum.AAC.4